MSHENILADKTTPTNEMIPSWFFNTYPFITYKNIADNVHPLVICIFFLGSIQMILTLYLIKVGINGRQSKKGSFSSLLLKLEAMFVGIYLVSGKSYSSYSFSDKILLVLLAFNSLMVYVQIELETQMTRRNVLFDALVMAALSLFFISMLFAYPSRILAIIYCSFISVWLVSCSNYIYLKSKDSLFHP